MRGACTEVCAADLYKETGVSIRQVSRAPPIVATANLAVPIALCSLKGLACQPAAGRPPFGLWMATDYYGKLPVTPSLCGHALASTLQKAYSFHWVYYYYYLYRLHTHVHLHRSIYTPSSSTVFEHHWLVCCDYIPYTNVWLLPSLAANIVVQCFATNSSSVTHYNAQTEGLSGNVYF